MTYFETKEETKECDTCKNSGYYFANGEKEYCGCYEGYKRYKGLKK